MTDPLKLVLYATQNNGYNIIKYLTSRKDADIKLVIIYPDQKNFRNTRLISLLKKLKLPFKIYRHDLLLFPFIKRINPDIIFSVSWRNKIPLYILKCSKMGGVNLHIGLLPQYSGTFINAWPLINGENEAGSTLHWMTDTFDMGNIIHEEKFPITAWDTGSEVFEKLSKSCVLGFKKAWPFARNWLKESWKQKGKRKFYSLIDYKRTNKIDLEKNMKVGDFINLLRGKTFKGFKVAYFVDPITQKKVYVSINLTSE